jgi:hypothetical protein
MIDHSDAKGVSLFGSIMQNLSLFLSPAKDQIVFNGRSKWQERESKKRRRGGGVEKGVSEGKEDR